MLAENEHLVPAGLSTEGGNGRALVGLLLLAMGAGGGLYLWKFHNPLLASFRGNSPAQMASAKPHVDEAGPRSTLHAASADPAARASAPTTAAGAPRPRDRLVVDAGKRSADPVQDASALPPPVEHSDAAALESVAP